MASKIKMFGIILVILVTVSIVSFMYQGISRSSPKSYDNSLPLSLKTEKKISRPSYIGSILCGTRMQAHNRQKFLTKFEESRDTNSSSILRPTGEVFHHIYSNFKWGTDGGGSGDGSDPANGLVAGHMLRLVIYKYGFTSLLDAPCGAVSASWTKHAVTAIKKDMSCFRYHGVDVVDKVISNNSVAFENHSTWAKFSVVDLSSPLAKLPAGYDLILSRDALQHLSYRHIAGAIASYCRSDAQFLLVGSYIDAPASNNNKDIITGDYFNINVLAPPFSFPSPLEILPERGRDSKYLLLYSIDSICLEATVTSFIKTHVEPK